VKQQNLLSPRHLRRGRRVAGVLQEEFLYILEDFIDRGIELVESFVRTQGLELLATPQDGLGL
jgi:hypothetical protein